MGKVYVARGGGLYKFGNSENPSERLKQLQTGSPVKLELVYTFEVKAPKKIETELKRTFADKHAHGEWFRLSEDDLAYVRQAMPQSTTATPIPPLKNAGATTGVLKALSDIWVHRYYLLLWSVASAFILVLLESYHNPLSGYIETGIGAPTAFVATPVAQPVPTPILGDAPSVVQPPPLQGHAQPIEQPQQEPVVSELVPINDATAAALGAIVPPQVVPTIEGWAVQWPTPTLNAVQLYAPTAQAVMEEAGYQPLQITIEIPKNFVGR